MSFTRPPDPSLSERPPVAWAPAPDQPVGPAPGVRFAPHVPRLVAYLIDTLVLLGVVIVMVLVGALIIPLGGRGVAGAILAIVWIVTLLVLLTGYFAWSWAHGGQTLGMKPFRLYVVRDADGGPVSNGRAWLRVFGLFVVDGAIVYLGFLWVFLDARRRAWHDLIAQTVVIQR